MGSNKQNKEWKRRNNSKYHRNTKKKKRERIPLTVICQQLGQPRRNGRLSRNKPSRLNQKEIDNLNRWISSIKIEFVIKKHSQQT